MGQLDLAELAFANVLGGGAVGAVERYWVPPWQMRLYLRATWTIRRPSLMLWLTGFSTYTSLPACMAQMAARECQWLGVAMETMSTDLSSKIRRMSWTNLGLLLNWPATFSPTALSASQM